MKLFHMVLWGVKRYEQKVLWSTKVLCSKQFYMKSSIKEEKTDIELLSYLKINWDNLVCVHIYAGIYTHRVLDGVPKFSAER